MKPCILHKTVTGRKFKDGSEVWEQYDGGCNQGDEDGEIVIYPSMAAAKERISYIRQNCKMRLDWNTYKFKIIPITLKSITQ